LADGAIRALFVAKVKTAALVILALSIVVVGASMLARSAPGSQEQSLLPATDADDRADRQSVLRADLFGDPLPEGALARLGSSRLRHENLVGVVAFFPDGRRIASGARDCVRLWDATTGKALGQLQTDAPWQ